MGAKWGGKTGVDFSCTFLCFLKIFIFLLYYLLIKELSFHIKHVWFYAQIGLGASQKPPVPIPSGYQEFAFFFSERCKLGEISMRCITGKRWKRRLIFRNTPSKETERGEGSQEQCPCHIWFKLFRAPYIHTNIKYSARIPKRTTVATQTHNQEFKSVYSRKGVRLHCLRFSPYFSGGWGQFIFIFIIMLIISFLPSLSEWQLQKERYFCLSPVFYISLTNDFRHTEQLLYTLHPASPNANILYTY